MHLFFDFDKGHEKQNKGRKNLSIFGPPTSRTGTLGHRLLHPPTPAPAPAQSLLQAHCTVWAWQKRKGVRKKENSPLPLLCCPKVRGDRFSTGLTPQHETRSREKGHREPWGGGPGKCPAGRRNPQPTCLFAPNRAKELPDPDLTAGQSSISCDNHARTLLLTPHTPPPRPKGPSPQMKS